MLHEYVNTPGPLHVPSQAQPSRRRQGVAGAVPVLILRDVDELTAAETGAELGITVEAVKSRLHRARSMVRERLIDSGYWQAEA